MKALLLGESGAKVGLLYFCLTVILLFQSDPAVAFSDTNGDLCDRIMANKPLDLFLIGFNEQKILMVTSKQTGYLVYEEPASAWDPIKHQWKLTAPPVPMAYKWPAMVTSELFKVLEAKDPMSPAGKVFPFTAVNDEAKNFLVLYNKDDPAMYDFQANRMIKIKSTENRWTNEMEGFISTTDQKSSYEISLGYNGTTDKMMLNRSFAFISSRDTVQDIFQGDQNTFHICQPNSSFLQFEKDINCQQSVAWVPMRALKFSFSDTLKFFYLFSPTVIIYFQEDYSKAVPYQTKLPKDFFICPSKYYSSTPNPDVTSPGGGNSSKTSLSDSKIAYLILGILLLTFLLILFCTSLYCLGFADKKEDKRENRKRTKQRKTTAKKTKTPIKKKKSKRAGKTSDMAAQADKSGDPSSGSKSVKGKVKKSAFAGKDGLPATKTGKLGKESQATVIDQSTLITLRSGMQASKKRKLPKSKIDSPVSDSGGGSSATVRSKASASKKKGKSVLSSSFKPKGGSSNA